MMPELSAAIRHDRGRLIARNWQHRVQRHRFPLSHDGLDLRPISRASVSAVRSGLKVEEGESRWRGCWVEQIMAGLARVSDVHADRDVGNGEAHSGNVVGVLVRGQTCSKLSSYGGERRCSGKSVSSLSG